MKPGLKYLRMHFFALLFMVSVAHAQPMQQAQSYYSQPALEQMLAPIALYPDALLSQVLMAATYPTEVVEASYWLRANPGLRGENAIRAAENQPWDISVKSLLPFPQVLGTMESKLDWTENLGNAFLGQEQQVMDTIQHLRHKAMAAGYLRSDNRIRVVVQDQLISIVLVRPTAVYVPYYNPMIVYGTWWAPAYAPVYWDPWPGYVVAPGYNGWYWAAATIVTVGVLYAIFDWRRHSVYYGRHVNYWHRHHDYSHYRYSGTGTQRWSHDPRHRRDIPYRSPTVNQRFGGIATTYNARVGPRPTVQDIRTGRHKFAPVSRTSGRTGATVTPSRTGTATQRKAAIPIRTSPAAVPGTVAPAPVRTERAPAPVRMERAPAPVRTERVPAPVGAERAPAPVRMERAPAPVRTERVPAPVGAERVPAPVRMERAPAPVGAERVPAPVRTERMTDGAGHGASVPDR